jgi:membrane protein
MRPAAVTGTERNGWERRRDDARGRWADQPQEIPARGWKDVLFRLKDRLLSDNISIMAAGVAFYGFLAIPSALTAMVAIYGLVFNPADAQRQLGSLQGILPEEAAGVIAQQLASVTAHANSTLSISAVVAILVALWGVRASTATLIAALNVGYEEPEKRGFLYVQAVAFGLGLGVILFILISIALVGVLPAILALLPFGALGKTLASILRWPLLLVLLMVGLAALYRYPPSREEPKWQWVSPGAILATVLWLVGSILFSVYVGEFASYNKTYGSLGAVVVLMMWLYLTAYAVLLGAELNAELEHQTAQDTTTGPRLPMGRRGARMADTVAGLSEAEGRRLAKADGPSLRDWSPPRRDANVETARETIERDIAWTRDRLAEALDAAKDLLSPFRFIHRATDTVRAGIDGSDPRMRARLGADAAPLATIGAGLAWLILREWRRERQRAVSRRPATSLLAPAPARSLLEPPARGPASDGGGRQGSAEPI